MANAINEIDRAARAEQMKKVTQQYDKLCEQFQTIKEKLNQSLTDTYSTELLQVEQKWRSTISEIDKSIAYYESKAKEEYNPETGAGLNEDELKLLEDLQEQKRQAVALEAQEELSIVQRAEAARIFERAFEQTDQVVKKEYQAKISAAQSAIAKLKALGEEENKDRIRQLEEQIKALKQKMDEETAAIEKSAGKGKATTGIGKLLDIDWKNFKKDWGKNLSDIADVIKDFADTAMQLFESISQLQSNKEKAALNEYMKGYDERKKKLDWQLEQGIISQEYYNAQVEQLDKERDAKEKQLEIEQFRREKKAAIAEAIISGIVAAVKSFENGGGFPWGLISMALSLAATGVQVAAIASQPEPYAKGGYGRARQGVDRLKRAGDRPRDKARHRSP